MHGPANVKWQWGSPVSVMLVGMSRLINFVVRLRAVLKFYLSRSLEPHPDWLMCSYPFSQIASKCWDQSLASLHCRHQTSTTQQTSDFSLKKVVTFSADPLKQSITSHNHFMCLLSLANIHVVGGFWYWTTGCAFWVAAITKHFLSYAHLM
jgi:hypothetical protein